MLELKVRAKDRTLERALAEAKRQLLEQDYAAELRAHGATPIQQVAAHATDPVPPRAARHRH